MYIQAKTLPDAWFQAVYNLIDYDEELNLKNGILYRIDQGSYEESWRLEYPFVAIEIEHPLDKPQLPDFPPHTGLPPIADMTYVYQYFIEYFMGAEVPPNTAYTYGSRINKVLFKNKARNHNMTQLEYLIERLNEHPRSNQLVLQVAEPDDLTLDDPPCLRSIALKVIDRDIDLHVYFRSNDLWAGFPLNTACLSMFLKYLTVMTEFGAGKIYYFCSGLHIYHHNFEHAAIRCQKDKLMTILDKQMDSNTSKKEEK
jgi:thymidylate synthase